jgi:hypothetical protein
MVGIAIVIGGDRPFLGKGLVLGAIKPDPIVVIGFSIPEDGFGDGEFGAMVDVFFHALSIRLEAYSWNTVAPFAPFSFPFRAHLGG